MARRLALFSAFAALLCAPTDATVYFKETFDTEPFKDGRWVQSKWKDGESMTGKFELSHGEFFHDAKADLGLKTTQDHRFYTATAKFPKFSNKDKTLVIQYQVKNEQAIECGGGYLKIGPAIEDQTKFTGDTNYNIMFGPDICGATRKTHVIFNYGGKNLDRKRDVELRDQKQTHLYTLIVKPDNTYEVRIDNDKVASGSLYEDWPFLKPKTIKDPAQSKPKDWVDEREIDDPEDKKPADWVDEKQIPDSNAKKPEDWDDEEDGDWTPPMIDNPAFKGEWKAKRIPNPAYKGEWVHPEIPNPEFVDDPNIYSYADFSMVGIDLWQVKAGSIFDNIIITDSIEEAEAFAKETFEPLQKAEKEKKEAKEKAEKEAADKAAKEAAEASKSADSVSDDDDDSVETKDEL